VTSSAGISTTSGRLEAITSLAAQHDDPAAHRTPPELCRTDDQSQDRPRHRAPDTRRDPNDPRAPPSTRQTRRAVVIQDRGDAPAGEDPRLFCSCHECSLGIASPGAPVLTQNRLSLAARQDCCRDSAPSSVDVAGGLPDPARDGMTGTVLASAGGHPLAVASDEQDGHVVALHVEVAVGEPSRASIGPEHLSGQREWVRAAMNAGVQSGPCARQIMWRAGAGRARADNGESGGHRDSPGSHRAQGNHQYLRCCGQRPAGVIRREKVTVARPAQQRTRNGGVGGGVRRRQQSQVRSCSTKLRLAGRNPDCAQSRPTARATRHAGAQATRVALTRTAE
jgi:hypothetical protein